MLKNGFDVTTIADISALSELEVIALKSKLK